MELELVLNNRPFPELFNLKENYDVSGVGGLLNIKDGNNENKERIVERMRCSRITLGRQEPMIIASVGDACILPSTHF